MLTSKLHVLLYVNISLRRIQEQEQQERQKSDQYNTDVLISCAKNPIAPSLRQTLR